MSFKQIAFSAGLALSATAVAGEAQYVIGISVDGMGSSYAKSLMDSGQLPNIKRLFDQGAGTMNARTDAGVAVTLPNHIGMVTGRPMLDYATPPISGHGWTGNTDPGGATLYSNKGSYVASVFDVVHDNGKSTAMWSGKTKFSLFDASYDATNGANDTTGADNGKDKLDYVYIRLSDPAATLTADFLGKMNSTPYNFSFVHYQDPDAAGHLNGWGGIDYNNALKAVDTQIGNILSAVENSPTLNGKTMVILTADHGGQGTNHGNTGSILDTQIPFLTWGAGVNAGDIYSMNAGVLADPLTSIPGYSGLQPIRNTNMANLALDALDLGAVPGSTVGVSQNIAVPEPSSLALAGVAGLLAMRRKPRAA